MNPATLLARLAVEALVAAGVRHAVLCPGSRSAPLAYALAAAEALGGPVLHVRHDERVAAFTALGAGTAGAGPAAVVTTSGTAVANLHPAVLEAHHADRPLVVVTADRPRALRGTWANQTTELQAGLFGAALRGVLDLEDVDAAKDPDAARARLDALLASARGGPAGRAGPVQLDLGFGEPLLPDGDDLPWVLPARRPHRAAPAGRPGPAPASPPADPLELPPGARTVVLAGDGAGPDARALAERAGWPLLAEPSSGARGGPNAVGPYRLLLELDAWGGAVERAVVFGRPTLSRPVTRLVGRPDVDVVLVSPYPDRPEPGRPVRRAVHVTAPAPEASSGRRLRSWRVAGRAAAAAIDGVLDGEAAAGRLTGPWLARELAAALRPGELLVTAASNPVRDLDLAARPLPDGPAAHVIANRGLAGIDGTVSTALGAALAAGVPARVLVGDVAFLHDLGALLAGPREARPDLQIVVLNDDGGGIFSLLEHGGLAEAGPEQAAAFDRLFGTPHGADLASLCRGFGVRHERVGDAARARAVLAEPAPGVSVVEVPADRSGLRALHARLRSAAHVAAHEAAHAAPHVAG